MLPSKAHKEGPPIRGVKMLNERYKEMAIAMDSGRAAIVAVMQAGVVTAREVAELRRAVTADRTASREEAEALFALEASPALKCAEWTAFFIETLTDHVVWQARPTGVVNESQGEWLIRSADTAASLNALALLVNVLAEAHRVPMWFLAAVRTRAAAGWAGVDVAALMAQAEMAQAA